jgi:FkbM family methyltransferase
LCLSLATNLAQIWSKVWPLSRGRYLPLRALSLFPPQWCDIQGTWFRLHPDDWIQRQLLIHNEYEPDVSRLVGSLEPGATFVDVGANIGYFSFLASRVVGPTGRVIAMEPNPRTAARFRENLKRNQFRNIQLHEVALADAAGESDFFLAPDSGSSSFSSASADSHDSARVKCVQGDSLLSDLTRLDFLKMDVEGAEFLALRGMDRTIARFRPVIVIEISNELLTRQGATADGIRQLLMAHGYHETPLDDKTSQFRVP